MNTCTLCLQQKPWSEFEPNARMRSGYLNQCRKCKYQRRIRSAESRAQKNAVHRRWKLKALYGVTEEQYSQLLESQNGVCAICKENDRHGRLLAVDHDHETGAVRGLLCGDCNVMLGGAQDNTESLQAGIDYLLTHRVRGCTI